MKYTFFTIYSFFLLASMSAQNYTHQESKPIVEYYYPTYIKLYAKSKKLLNAHRLRKQKPKATQKEINILAFKINAAFGYMNLSAFKKHKQSKELKLRFKAIKKACKVYGLDINPRLVNLEYNILYGDTVYACHHKGSKKPKSWSKFKSKQVRTLANTYVTTKYSSRSQGVIAASK